MPKDIRDKISATNQELKSAGTRVSIYQKGRRLVLKAYLPPKPWSKSAQAQQGKWYRQKLYLGLTATPAGLRRAKVEALKLWSEVELDKFDWSNWATDPTEKEKDRTIAEWIANFEEHYKHHAIAHESRESEKVATTWEKDYSSIYRKLPQDGELTAEVMEAIVLAYEPHRKTRRRAAMAMRRLAEFAGIDLDLTGKTGHYGIHHTAPRDLPDDETIEEIYHSFSDNPPWQWVFGMMATYGLRPGEAWLCDLDRFVEDSPVLWVCSEKQRNGRRNFRSVLPFPARWWQEWRLWEGSPPFLEGRTANLVCQFFKRRGVGFRPYNLRHRWAVRTLEMGLDPMLAAKQMGHSAHIHERTYLYWMEEKTHLSAWEKANQG
ncbi:MAG: hypothetical protein J7642_21185 [Cyanobacteria bacterium SBC]|nr:hypothetical protein [Cyanobacteria bacterium SBC]